MLKRKCPAFLALAATIWTSGCATATSDFACPEVAVYSGREQIEAADELAELGEGSVLELFMRDYLQLRDRLRIICPLE